MAPEVILGYLYTFMPDWWSVGIVIYQLMNKKSPFEEDNIPQLLQSIVNDRWNFTDEAINRYSPQLLDLVEKLLVKDPSLRLGAKSDMEEILAHTFFQKKLISPNMVNLKPEVYNFVQDFLNVKHRKQVAKEFNDKSDYKNENVLD